MGFAPGPAAPLLWTALPPPHTHRALVATPHAGGESLSDVPQRVATRLHGRVGTFIRAKIWYRNRAGLLLNCGLRYRFDHRPLMLTDKYARVWTTVEHVATIPPGHPLTHPLIH